LLTALLHPRPTVWEHMKLKKSRSINTEGEKERGEKKAIENQGVTLTMDLFPWLHPVHELTLKYMNMLAR
jgi:hypothetical protein